MLLVTLREKSREIKGAKYVTSSPERNRGGKSMSPDQVPDQPNEPGYQGYPPPPPEHRQPGYPQPGQGYPGPGNPRPANRGFDLQDLFQRWQAVISGRNVPTFDEQLPSANWLAIWIGLAILGIVRGITSAIGSAFASSFTINGHVYAPSSPISSFFSGIIGTIIGFFIGVGILYLIAKMFNGSGTFLSYAYLLSLIFVPLGAISAIIGLIPVIGGLVALAIGIFEIYLAILATASAHRLPMDRATWVVLIPVIVGLVIALLLFIAAAALFVALGL
jgi:hypothetical protein